MLYGVGPNELFGVAYGIFVLSMIASAVGLVSYILESIAVMRMAKKRGVENYGLSWMPFANVYIFGRVSEVPDKKRNTGIALFVLKLVDTILLIAAGVMSFNLLSEIEFDLYRQFDLNAFPWTNILVMFILLIAVYAVSVAYLIVYLAAYYRICRLFAGDEKYTGYFVAGLVTTILGIGLVTPILLLVLSFKKPTGYAGYGKPVVTETYIAEPKAELCTAEAAETVPEAVEDAAEEAAEAVPEAVEDAAEEAAEAAAEEIPDMPEDAKMPDAPDAE